MRYGSVQNAEFHLFCSENRNFYKKITFFHFFFKNNLSGQKFCIYLHPQLSTGCSAVRLAHLLWEQGVPGSNPGIPTNKEILNRKVEDFLFLGAYEGGGIVHPLIPNLAMSYCGSV